MKYVYISATNQRQSNCSIKQKLSSFHFLQHITFISTYFQMKKEKKGTYKWIIMSLNEIIDMARAWWQVDLRKLPNWIFPILDRIFIRFIWKKIICRSMISSIFTTLFAWSLTFHFQNLHSPINYTSKMYKKNISWDEPISSAVTCLRGIFVFICWC